MLTFRYLSKKENSTHKTSPAASVNKVTVEMEEWCKTSEIEIRIRVSGSEFCSEQDENSTPHQGLDPAPFMSLIEKLSEAGSSP